MPTPTFGSDELAQFRKTFFEECTELLADLEERLGALTAFSGDIESLNAIFRAVHSVKAGAGAFGYSVLVGFAHRFEALLDRLRDGTADLDERTLAALVAAAGPVLIHLLNRRRFRVVQWAAMDFLRQAVRRSRRILRRPRAAA